MTTPKTYRDEALQRQQRRLAEAKATARPFPNIAEADAMRDHRKDPPTTMLDYAQAQASMVPPAQLSPETVAGLQALKLDEQATTPPAPAPTPAAEKASAEPEEYDELAEMFRSAKRDSIRNNEEREAVAKRCAPIDLAHGIATGEFTQKVPIIPGVLEVTYRSLSQYESQRLRLALIKAVEKEPQLETMAAELLGLYQLAASVVSINGSVPGGLPPHIERNGFKVTFLEDIWERRLSIFYTQPGVVIHAMGVHASWFHDRVTALFATTETLKNG